MLDQVQTVCVRAYPYLVYLDNDNDEFFERLRDNTSLSPDVETRIRQLFKQLYGKSLSVETVINTMLQYKTSPDPVPRELFAGFVHSLIDEYRFYAHDYPTPALGVPAVLFGSIISYGFVSSIPLSICLKYVQEALRDEPGSKMFSFGVQALSLFTHKAPEWPQFFTRVLQNQRFVNTQPELAEEIRSLLGGDTNRTNASPQQTYASTIGVSEPSEEQPIFSAIRVPSERPDGLQFLEPTESIRDKILFNINNLTKSNLEAKLQSFKENLTRDVYAWFAHYLVTKRAIVEANNHDLYFSLLDGIENMDLMKQIDYETYSAALQLINSETVITNSTERGTLKTLGSWLGGLTMARNKPILHNNIAVKELLLEGYDSNRLIVVIPFVAKILEQCGKSKIFNAQNAWVNGILRLFSEFYFSTELKSNLIFEIELTCRVLGVKIQDIPQATILKERDERTRIEKEQMEQVASRAAREERDLGRYNEAIYDQQQQQLQIQQLQDTQLASRTSGALLSTMLNNVAQTINVSPSTQLFGTHHGLRQILTVAIQNAIRDVFFNSSWGANILGVSLYCPTSQRYRRDGFEGSSGKRFRDRD
jgi:CCR4-NOT transcription complex subunit 1